MRHINLLAACGRLALGLALAPLAAVPATAADFTGAYAGVLFGHESGIAELGLYEVPVRGGFAGLELGATYQMQNGWVLGLALDVERSYTTGKVMDGNYMGYDGNGELSAHLLGKVGYAIDSVLPYLTGGLAYARTNASMFCLAGATYGDCMYTGPFVASAEDERIGYSVGAGVEMALNDHISFKAEYLYSDYGTEPITLVLPGPTPATSDVAISSSALRTGLMLRF